MKMTSVGFAPLSCSTCADTSAPLALYGIRTTNGIFVALIAASIEFPTCVP